MIKTKLLLKLLCCLLSLSIQAQNTKRTLLPAQYASIKTGDTLTLRQMLNEGVPVDAAEEDGKTLLMKAAAKGDLAQIKFLLEAGADVEQKSNKGYTPLYYAASENQKEAIDMLLKAGADLNKKGPLGLSITAEISFFHNLTMTRYLLEKGAKVDEKEIKELLCYLTYQHNEKKHMRADVYTPALKLWLQQGEKITVSPQDIKNSKLLSMYAISSEQATELSLKFRLLQLQFIEEAKQEQQKEQQRKERKLAELREQDSLRNLMETGNYDHKKWELNTSIRIIIEEDGTSRTGSWIHASPRVDYLHNHIGEGATPTLVLLSILVAVIFVWVMSKKVFPSIRKEEGMFFLMLYFVVIQSIILYFMFSSLYTDFDELIVRNTGKEYAAKYDYTGFHFVTADSIAVVVKGVCTFDGGVDSETCIPIRYDDTARKLVVDMQKYTLRNWNQILLTGILLLLNFLLCYGKFNFLLKKVFRTRHSKHDTPYQDYIYFPWHFKNKKYETFDQFKSDLEHCRAEWDMEDYSDKTYETPCILIRYNRITEKNSPHFEIEILPDNGKYISMDEWIYKLQNELAPYMESLGEPDSANVWILKGWTAGKEMKCDLSLFSSLEDSDVILADVIWKFTETEYTDYRTFIREVIVFQSEHGNHFWNPDVVVIKQPSFTLCYYNPQTRHMEVYDMEADNGVTFTEGEILYKIHNRMKDILPGQEFCYLQYLIFRSFEADTLEELEKKQNEKELYDLFTTNEI
ncbi:ankyrin repeat domain-containing protein [Bacteroides nordii]